MRNTLDVLALSLLMLFDVIARISIALFVLLEGQLLAGLDLLNGRTHSIRYNVEQVNVLRITHFRNIELIVQQNISDWLESISSVFLVFIFFP